MDSLETIKIGTCAWSFEDWRDSFYPAHLPPAERLAFYARHFHAVEVDATFYHAPAPNVARHWAEATPPGFVFACKAPREITHERRLRESTELIEAFIRSLDPLGEKLGCVLLQLPPSFRVRRDEKTLRDFVRVLPRSVRFAIEFRDHGWHLPRIVHLLEEHRICWVWTDTTPLDHQQEGAFEFLPQTTDFAYVRLLGDFGEKYAAEGRTPHEYRGLMWRRDVSLENWAARLRQRVAELNPMFVLFNNHFEGFAPLSARRFASLVGLAVPAFGAEAEPALGADPQLPLL